MTITIPSAFLYYCIFAIIFETIYQYIAFRYAYKKFKQSQSYDALMPVFNDFKEHPQYNHFFKKVFSPPTYVLGYIIFCIIAPLLFPFTVINKLRTVIWGKSKSEKQLEQFYNDAEQAQTQSDTFMENEGMFNPNHDFSIEDQLNVLTSMQQHYYMNTASFSPQDYYKISEMIGDLKKYFINCDSFKAAVLRTNKK